MGMTGQNEVSIEFFRELRQVVVTEKVARSSMVHHFIKRCRVDQMLFQALEGLKKSNTHQNARPSGLFHQRRLDRFRPSSKRKYRQGTARNNYRTDKIHALRVNNC
jgi:hypothetical protein